METKARGIFTDGTYTHCTALPVIYDEKFNQQNKEEHSLCKSINEYSFASYT